jgi:glycerol-3-phosphate dehydrogenase
MIAALGPSSRNAALRTLEANVVDLLIVGAGATGAGTALDAVTRGLSVMLIDQGDIAGGTSSRSSQLVHGGLRYLQQGDLALVREALRERELLLTAIAPGLVRPLPFLLPLTRGLWERALVGAGLTIYDMLAGSGIMPRHRHRSRATAMERFPDLRRSRLLGAIEYYDAQMDDARLAVAIARTAAAHGAHVATHVALVGSHGVSSDGVHRVSVRDRMTGDERTVSARSIALCSGVWAPEVSAIFNGHRSAVDVVRSKGVHLRLPRSAINGNTALIVPRGRSVLFVLPSADHWLVGTTDTPWPNDINRVAPDERDISFLLAELDGIVTSGVTAADVTYAFAGLRPLVRDQAVGGDTAKVTREHRISRVAPRVFAIVGGKWTTYRVMARDLVDTILRDAQIAPRPCRTDSIPLVDNRAEEVATLIAADPSLADQLVGAPGYTRADVVQACIHEGAITVDDVVDRRLRLRLHLDVVPDTTLADIESVIVSIRPSPTSRA